MVKRRQTKKKQAVPEKAKALLATKRRIRISYTRTKDGQNRAYYNRRIGGRWLPIPIADAEYLLKHGKATYIKKSERMKTYW